MQQFWRRRSRNTVVLGTIQILRKYFRGEGGSSVSSASSFSFIYPTVSSGTQSIHSHAVKMEVITQKILEMNTREETVG